ncbi:helix-turn-helix transcriptional regulator [Cloacibacillus sp. An23]|uniref:helix-turn-helix domain-containing protein n=1 Tax=Cloacibacillus sp. An23 TaxID=1965591 RepID=UPI000B38E6F0|nr:helix-turn-helix transcriptional regulator [Cloacibacillus sp. An23]OUO94707.1 hypothetical protein B5F39_02235 [Cloacibacillus sp. An23]
MKGERITKRQKEIQIKTKDLLEGLNISSATLSRWKNNINEPDDETKLKLAQFLHTSVAYLMGESDEPEVEIQLLGLGLPKEKHQGSGVTNPFIRAGATTYDRKTDRKQLLEYDESNSQNMKAVDPQSTILTLGTDTIALLLRDKVKTEAHLYDKTKREIIAQALHETLAILIIEDNKKTDEKTA